MRKLTYILISILAVAVSSHAEDFASVRRLASGNSEIKLNEGLSIQGIIVSDRTSLNMADNSNSAWNKVNLGDNFRTLYVQSEDGRYGFRIISNSIYNTITKFSKVNIALGGATLLKEDNPERYTIMGLDPEDFTILEEGVVPSPKVRTIAELCDEDVYTYVTVSDVELSSKHGAYTNVYEPCVQKTSLNEFKGTSSRTDTWASMLKDSNGDALYMLVNTKCIWRRTGDWLPQGKGQVAGVLVYSALRRHGGVGRYAIRPASSSEIMLDKAAATDYLTVVEWNWNRNYECALNLEKGPVEWILKDELAADRILPDEGFGYLSTTCGAKMSVVEEYDARNAQDGCETTVGGSYGQGRREYGAVSFVSDVWDWYRFEAGKAIPAHAVLIETSTKGFESGIPTLDLTWIAGFKRKIDNAWGFPAHWKVRWSDDGQSFHDTGVIIPLRPLYWSDKKIQDIGDRELSLDAAMGYTEYSVKLPVELLGKERVVIRIEPASDALVEIPVDYTAAIDGRKMTEDFSHKFYLNVGKVALKIAKKN